jgi:hypothetical protein
MSNHLKNRYTFYAMANHVTVEEQRKLDAEKYPSGVLMGFKIWIHQAKIHFKDHHPELIANGVVMDNDAFTKFIGQQVMAHLGLETEA